MVLLRVISANLDKIELLLFDLMIGTLLNTPWAHNLFDINEFLIVN
jgi:hypothetical protein